MTPFSTEGAGFIEMANKRVKKTGKEIEDDASRFKEEEGEKKKKPF